MQRSTTPSLTANVAGGTASSATIADAAGAAVVRGAAPAVTFTV
jgi:hypothetical protein